MDGLVKTSKENVYMATNKKIIKVEDDGSTSSTTTSSSFKVSAESKQQATKFRLIAIVMWLVAIGAEVFAILQLNKVPINMVLIIALIVVDLILAIGGSLLWKKSNRFDPASEKDKIRFFIQNQLGVIIAMIAFLPLAILILTNKNMDKKQKSLLGAIAGIALIIAGFIGADLNPVSVEQLDEQTAQVERLSGANLVYWTEHGGSYHLYKDCYHINGDKTAAIYEGTVAKSRELKNIDDICNTCVARAEKEKGMSDEEAADKDK